MASPGETLLDQSESTSPEEMDAMDAAEAPVEEPKPKRRRTRKKKEPEAEETTVEQPDEPSTELASPSEPETPEPTSESPDQPAWLKRLEDEAGFQNVNDVDDAAARAVDQIIRQRKELDEYERKLRDAEYRSVAAQPVPEPEQKEQRKPWQAPVEYPQNATRYLTRNEEGVADWKSDTPAEVRAQAEKYLAWQTEIADTIVNRPDIFFNDILPQFISEHVKNEIEPFYEQKTAEERRNELLTQFERDNADWLFTKDPQTGEPAWGNFSRIGAALSQEVSAELSAGRSPEEALDYAQYRIQRQTGQSPWVRQETQPDVAQQRQESRSRTLRKPLRNAETVPQRSGSFTDSDDERSQNGHLSAGRSLINRMKREGISPPYEAVT